MGLGSSGAACLGRLASLFDVRPGFSLEMLRSQSDTLVFPC